MIELSTRMGRFVEAARRRLDVALGHAGRDDGAAELRTEAHALAGEAAILGLVELATAARQVEADARAWLDRGDMTARVKAARGVRGLHRALDGLARSVASASAARGAADGRAPADAIDERHRVLVIDDSLFIRDQIADALVAAKLQAQAAGSLEAALDAVQAFKPTLVITDVNMPGLACGELCGRLRMSATEPLRIMLMSGMPDPELDAHARALGAEFWVSKRGGLDVVVEQVVAALRPARADRDA